MIKRKQPRTDLYKEERAKGMTYREIAEKHGVTYQAVACALGKSDAAKFRPWTKDRCIYPNLRNWLNENKVSLKEFVRRTDAVSSGRNLCSYSAYFSGKHYPQKAVIDKILEVTGLTYEKLWEVDNG